jgi:transcriptional regulator with XRE-family HTH domain
MVSPLPGADPGLDPDLPPDQSRAIAVSIREELARRRLSREALAHQARISLSTLEKALSGRRPFTLATTVRLEEALGVPLRPARPAACPPASGFAPEQLGHYTRPAVSWLEGDYLTLRPSFDQPGAVYAYRTLIRWNDTDSALAFSETSRLDAAFTQSGQVSMSNQSGHIYLVTVQSGQYRLIVLGRPTITREMYGLITTLQAGVGSQLVPASAPIALVPLKGRPDPVLGMIGAEHAEHAGYRAHLDRTTRQSYARFFT